MKEGIHPNYQQTTIRCACGNVIETGSTKQDIRVEVCSNIGTIKDMDGAHRNGAEGVGLYRTEFLFMDRDALPTEEEQFARTLERGLALLDEELSKLKGDTLDGETAFRLYDTYGFPLDLTADICREREIAIDQAGFDAAMETQRAQSRAASSFKMGGQLDYTGSDTRFEGYGHTTTTAHIVALYQDGQAVTQLTQGHQGVVVLNNTPFYAEGGGQVGDVGTLSVTGGVDALFDVTDTQKIQAAVFGHHGVLARGTLTVGDTVTATTFFFQTAHYAFFS